MNAIKTMTCLLTLACVTATADVASAQHYVKLQEATPYFDPGQPSTTLYYKMYVDGYFIPGQGLKLTYVSPYGPAVNVRPQFGGGPARLEVGDVIVEINGRQINNRYDYFYALNSSGGYARLLIKDIRGNGYIRCSASPRP